MCKKTNCESINLKISKIISLCIGQNLTFMNIDYNSINLIHKSMNKKSKDQNVAKTNL